MKGRMDAHQIVPDDLIWCRGIAYTACDVHPSAWSFDPQTPGEHGNVHWPTVPIPNKSVLCVPSFDMGRFMPRFLALPRSFRVTLVTNQEDVGVPIELWGLSKQRRLASHISMPLPLSDFLNDPRLLHWWVQNYDLTGCNPYSDCSPYGLSRNASNGDMRAISKISPIPIGLDLHSAGMTTRATGLFKLPRVMSPCEQARQHESIRTALPPWGARRLQLIAPFQCENRDRIAACKAVKRCGEACRLVQMPREELWRAIGNFSFVASPFGRGIDSHRTWEVLSLGSVPVVLSSSLDILLENYPVVIIRSWDELSSPGAMERWARGIRLRFGAQPFDSAMRRKLTTRFWTDKIRSKHTAQTGRVKHATQAEVIDRRPYSMAAIMHLFREAVMALHRL